jgi:hypothetical protein
MSIFFPLLFPTWIRKRSLGIPPGRSESIAACVSCYQKEGPSCNSPGTATFLRWTRGSWRGSRAVRTRHSVRSPAVVTHIRAHVTQIAVYCHPDRHEPSNHPQLGPTNCKTSFLRQVGSFGASYDGPETKIICVCGASEEDKEVSRCCTGTPSIWPKSPILITVGERAFSALYLVVSFFMEKFVGLIAASDMDWLQSVAIYSVMYVCSPKD